MQDQARLAWRPGAQKPSPAGLPEMDWPLAMRIAVVVLALAILYLRTPITFTHPQFRGEDAYWFRLSRLDGWASFQLSPGVVGYACSAQLLVAIFASLFKPAFAAAIFCYSAILITLAVVWLATSPRLDIPCKPLFALALVIVPMGYGQSRVTATSRLNRLSSLDRAVTTEPRLSV